MKKIFALMIAVAFGLGTIGCDDKPKGTTAASKKTETTTTTTTTDKKEEKSK